MEITFSVQMKKSSVKKLAGFEPDQFYYEAGVLTTAPLRISVNFKKLSPMTAANGSINYRLFFRGGRQTLRFKYPVLGMTYTFKYLVAKGLCFLPF